jgi:hypothetical protein
MSAPDQDPPGKPAASPVPPAFGRYLLNLAIIAIVYFLFTRGHWNFMFVLFAAAIVTWSHRIYAYLESRFQWAFWVLLGIGGLIVCLALYKAFAGG